MDDIDALLAFCTSSAQVEYLQAVKKYGTHVEAANHTGKNRRNGLAIFARIKLNAAQRGYSPEHDLHHSVPPTHQLKGASTYYDMNGTPRAQWVKSEAVRQSPEEIARFVVEGLKDDIPRAKPAKTPANTRQRNADLHNLYPITDYHMGMLAWGEECGEDWDLDISEETLYRWFEAAIAAAPDAATCTFAQMGDFLHWDGLEALTPASKHVLDADTRFQKVVRAAIRSMRRVIALLLTKHDHVHVIVCDANHDPASGVWLRELLSMHYEFDRRITVDTSPDTYYAYRHGKSMLMFHHGHKKAAKDVDSVFVGKFRPMYGETDYHYAHTGHLHHDRLIESNLMHIEQHETLAPKDAYASRAGYLSKRSAKCITYSARFGEVARITIRPEMLT